MKPIKLIMQAFGPYANKQEIDFTLLGEKTMFVVSGATGAGKTTIFDAISFAVYGKASGDDRSGIELRSQFAADETLTEVTLSFELRGERYLVKRSPQQEKKKTRGEGTTTLGTKAELYRLGEEEVLLAANARDVDEKIAEIIKIDCNQFRQIVMIPQGEFRKLLVSESKDKEKILQKLFHTEHFKGIEEILKEKSNQLRKQVEQSVNERNTFISRIQSEGNEKLAFMQQEDHKNVPELIEELTNQVREDEDDLQLFAKDIAVKEEQRDAIQKEIHYGNDIIEQLETKQKLALQKQQLADSAPAIEKTGVVISLAKKAAILQQYEDQCLETDKQVVVKSNDLKNEEKFLLDLQKALEQQRQELQGEENKASEREASQKEINRLQGLEKDVLSFSTFEKEMKELSSHTEKLKNNKKTLETNFSTLEEKLIALQNEKEAINEARVKQAEVTVTLATEKSYLEMVTALIENKKKLISYENEYSDSEDNLADIKKIVIQKNEELETLFEAWHKGQAGLFANKLCSESSCPVCGSLDHPNKAVLHDDMPTEEQIKAMQKEVKELEQEKQKKDSTYYEEKSKFETQMDKVIGLADQIGDHLPRKFLSSALEDLKEYFQAQCQKISEELKQIETKAKSLATVDKETSIVASEKATVKELLTKANEVYEQNYTTFVEKRRDLERLSETLPEGLRDEIAFRKMLLAEENRLQLLEKALKKVQSSVNESEQKIASARGTITSLQKAVNEVVASQKEALRIFDEQLLQLGFTSVEHYKQVKLPQGEIEKLETEVQAFQLEFRSVSDRYQELVSRLEKVKKPDINLLNERLATVTNGVTLLQEKRNILYHKTKTNAGIIEEIERINLQMASGEVEFLTVGDLAEIACGKNTYRITFERFVLASFLDEILLAANGRLNKMTNGRYQLERKTDRSKGSAQSGLELLVFDQYTGGSRHVKTLSGGESFKASLSLALGLADIVQGYAGGVSMETMFIDEGFGTLDPESLESAIETLIDIQSSGRLVGIISHVPELKERIDARFEVTSTHAGSVVSYYGDTVSQ
ncbi:SMC family ATPase [Bacillaceae bacterium IKA-2]|nr:SMC family ATPase [Bacillaceae bacterium IKA-2]